MSSRPLDSGSVLQRFQRQGLNAWVLIPVVGLRVLHLADVLLSSACGPGARDWILTGAAYAVFSALAFFAFGFPEVEERRDGQRPPRFRADGGLDRRGHPRRNHLLDLAAGSRKGQGSAARSSPGGGAALSTATDQRRPGLGFGNPAADYLASTASRSLCHLRRIDRSAGRGQRRRPADAHPPPARRDPGAGPPLDRRTPAPGRLPRYRRTRGGARAATPRDRPAPAPAVVLRSGSGPSAAWPAAAGSSMLTPSGCAAVRSLQRGRGSGPAGGAVGPGLLDPLPGCFNPHSGRPPAES